jgi:hypothetical protein
VNINGQYAGGAWTFPYRVNISKYVKQGVNELEIEVVNTWNNRFVGEAMLPPEKRIVRPLYEKWKGAPLLESGLLAPVRIEKREFDAVN